MSRVFVCGLGAVSPAGWTAAALREALAKGEPLPVQPLERPGWAKPLRARLVPPPAHSPAVPGPSPPAPHQPNHALRRRRRA